MVKLKRITKAAMDWESDQEGVVLHIIAGEGDAIPVNGRVAILGEEGESFEDLPNTADAEPTDTPAEKASAAQEAPKPSGGSFCSSTCYQSRNNASTNCIRFINK